MGLQAEEGQAHVGRGGGLWSSSGADLIVRQVPVLDAMNIYFFYCGRHAKRSGRTRGFARHEHSAADVCVGSLKFGNVVTRLEPVLTSLTAGGRANL